MCCETRQLKITVEGVDFDTVILDDAEQFVLFARVKDGTWFKGAANVAFLAEAHSILGTKISKLFDEAIATTP